MNELAQLAKAGNEEVVHDLLIAHTSFMKKTASFVCKKSIDEHDEEFSIAMSAFHDAIVTFEPSKGASFLTFAHLIIKRRLVDYIRKENARNEKLLYEDESSHTILDHQSIYTYTETQQKEARKQELVVYKETLAQFNLSFEELTKSSPKHIDARKTAFYIAQIIAESDELYTYLIETKKLPIKQIESLVEVSRKTIERHRKYIIAVVLLLNSDLTYLKDYVKGEII